MKRITTYSNSSVSTLLIYLLMVILAVFFLFPLVFMVVSSFKPEERIFQDLQSILPAFLPTELSLENFSYVFNRVAFWRFFFNSTFITSVTVILGLWLNSMLAFALARLYWPAKNVVLLAVIALAIVPLETIAVPMLVLVNNLPWFDGTTSWLDTYRVQILPFAAEAFSTFLFYQFFIGLPREIDESCYVDGVTPFKIYTHITVPLSRPVFATVAILQSLAIWNSYLWPLMVTRSEAVRPLPIAITALYVLNLQWGHILAFASLITVPVLVVFVLFQGWFVRSIATAGLKG
jgi:multiple sugar transport system permease protein